MSKKVKKRHLFILGALSLSLPSLALGSVFLSQKVAQNDPQETQIKVNAALPEETPTLDTAVSRAIDNTFDFLFQEVATKVTELKESFANLIVGPQGLSNDQYEQFAILSTLYTLFDPQNLQIVANQSEDYRQLMKNNLLNVLKSLFADETFGSNIYLNIRDVESNNADPLINTLKQNEITNIITSFLNNFQRNILNALNFDFTSNTTSQVINFYHRTSYFEKIINFIASPASLDMGVKRFYINLITGPDFSDPATKQNLYSSSLAARSIRDANRIFVNDLSAGFYNPSPPKENLVSTNEEVNQRTALRNRNAFIWDINNLNQSFLDASNLLKRQYQRDKAFLSNPDAIKFKFKDNASEINSAQSSNRLRFNQFFYDSSDFEIIFPAPPEIYQDQNTYPPLEIGSAIPFSDVASNRAGGGINFTYKVQLNNVIKEKQTFSLINSSQITNSPDKVSFASFDVSLKEIENSLNALKEIARVDRQQIAYRGNDYQNLIQTSTLGDFRTLVSDALLSLTQNNPNIVIVQDELLASYIRPFGLKFNLVIASTNADASTPEDAKSLRDALEENDSLTFRVSVETKNPDVLRYPKTNISFNISLLSILGQDALDTLNAEVNDPQVALNPTLGTLGLPHALDPQGLVNAYNRASEREKSQFFTFGGQNSKRFNYQFLNVTQKNDGTNNVDVTTKVSLAKHPNISKTYTSTLDLGDPLANAPEIAYRLKDNFKNATIPQLINNITQLQNSQNSENFPVELSLPNPNPNLSYRVLRTRRSSNNLGVLSLTIAISNTINDETHEYLSEIAVPQEIRNIFANPQILNLTLNRDFFQSGREFSKQEFLELFNRLPDSFRGRAFNIRSTTLNLSTFSLTFVRLNNANATTEDLSATYEVRPSNPIFNDIQPELKLDLTSLPIEGILSRKTPDEAVQNAQELAYTVVNNVIQTSSRDEILTNTTGSVNGGDLNNNFSYYLPITPPSSSSQVSYQVLSAIPGETNTSIILSVRIQSLENPAISRIYETTVNNLRPFSNVANSQEQKNVFGEIVNQQVQSLTNESNPAFNLAVLAGVGILTKNGISQNVIDNALNDAIQENNLENVTDISALNQEQLDNFKNSFDENFNSRVIKTLASPDIDTSSVTNRIDEVRQNFLDALQKEGLNADTIGIREILENLDNAKKNVDEVLHNPQTSLEDIKSFLNNDLKILQTVFESITNGNIDFEKLSALSSLLRNFNLSSFQKITSNVSRGAIYAGFALLGLLTITSISLLIRQKGFRSKSLSLSRRTLLSLSGIILSASIIGIVFLILRLF